MRDPCHPSNLRRTLRRNRARAFVFEDDNAQPARHRDAQPRIARSHVAVRYSCSTRRVCASGNSRRYEMGRRGRSRATRLARFPRTWLRTEQRAMGRRPSCPVRRRASSMPARDPHPDRRVFERVTADRLRMRIRRACTAAGVPNFSPHDLRHRRISLMHLGGAPWARIGEQVGQRDLAVTANTYTHVLPTRPSWTTRNSWPRRRPFSM